MEETLRSYGFVECEDSESALEFVCPEEYVSSLAEALGITDDVETLIIQVDLPDSAAAYVDGESWDVTVEEVLEALEDVF